MRFVLKLPSENKYNVANNFYLDIFHTYIKVERMIECYTTSLCYFTINILSEFLKFVLSEHAFHTSPHPYPTEPYRKKPLIYHWNSPT